MSGFWIAGGRQDGDLIELTVCVLEGQGNVEVEDDEQMEQLVAELALVLAAHRECILVPGDPYARDAEQLACCYATEQMWTWQRQAPRFGCPCGITYAIENSGWHGWAFFSLQEDGRYEDQVEECGCGRQLLGVHERRREADATGLVPLFE